MHDVKFFLFEEQGHGNPKFVSYMTSRQTVTLRQGPGNRMALFMLNEWDPHRDETEPKLPISF